MKISQILKFLSLKKYPSIDIEINFSIESQFYPILWKKVRELDINSIAHLYLYFHLLENHNHFDLDFYPYPSILFNFIINDDLFIFLDYSIIYQFLDSILLNNSSISLSDLNNHIKSFYHKYKYYNIEKILNCNDLNQKKKLFDLYFNFIVSYRNIIIKNLTIDNLYDFYHLMKSNDLSLLNTLSIWNTFDKTKSNITRNIIISSSHNKNIISTLRIPFIYSIRPWISHCGWNVSTSNISLFIQQSISLNYKTQMYQKKNDLYLNDKIYKIEYIKNDDSIITQNEHIFKLEMKWFQSFPFHLSLNHISFIYWNQIDLFFQKSIKKYLQSWCESMLKEWSNEFDLHNWINLIFNHYSTILDTNPLLITILNNFFNIFGRLGLFPFIHSSFRFKWYKHLFKIENIWSCPLSFLSPELYELSDSTFNDFQKIWNNSFECFSKFIIYQCLEEHTGHLFNYNYSFDKYLKYDKQFYSMISKTDYSFIINYNKKNISIYDNNYLNNSDINLYFQNNMDISKLPYYKEPVIKKINIDKKILNRQLTLDELEYYITKIDDLNLFSHNLIDDDNTENIIENEENIIDDALEDTNIELSDFYFSDDESNYDFD